MRAAEETRLESASRGHLLPIQVKPPGNTQGFSQAALLSHKPRGNYPMCQQAGSSELEGCQQAVPPALLAVSAVPHRPPPGPPLHTLPPPQLFLAPRTSLVRAEMETEERSLLAWEPRT